jgi:hypothetical protein
MGYMETICEMRNYIEQPYAFMYVKQTVYS